MDKKWGKPHTYHPSSGTSPSKGVVVSRPREEGAEHPFKVDSTDRAKMVEQVSNEIKSYAEKHWDRFRQEPDLYMGGWVEDDGSFCLDLNNVVPTVREGVRLGQERAQRGVFVLNTFETITSDQYQTILDSPPGGVYDEILTNKEVTMKINEGGKKFTLARPDELPEKPDSEALQKFSNQMTAALLGMSYEEVAEIMEKKKNT